MHAQRTDAPGRFSGARSSRSGPRWIPLVLGLVLLPALAVPPGCAKNPVTGQRQFVLFSEGQEISMGREADRDIATSMGVYEDEELARMLTSMGERMAARSERPDLPWTFRILDDPTVNAFALPGGYIYMTRGILAHLSSEAEVAGILGHEIGHVTARHGITRVSRAQFAQLGLGAAMILAPELRPFGDAVGAGVQLLFLRNSRNDERQADELGIQYMRSLDYDPRELATVFEMLARASGARDGDRIPGFLSTHPDPLDRRDEVLQRVEAAGEDLTDAVVGRDSYLRLLDGMVFGTNPREGFFRDAAFYHPDMAFRLDFPPGWQTANARTQVQGMSPERDAAVVLTLAQEASPSAARSTFLAGTGVETLGRSDDPVGGLPAAWAEFRVRGDEATFRGVAAFVRHGDLTFRILGYALEGAWNARRGAAVASLRSFQPVADPEILEVQPRRVEIVELPRDMTFEEFLREYPSTVPDEAIGTINHRETGDRVGRGTLLKRVVGGPSR
jgi:predicted Zn-dependent protease